MVETLLEVRQLSKTFRYRTGWFRQTVEAVKPLSFTCANGRRWRLSARTAPGIDPREDAGGHGGTHQRRTAD